MKITQQILDAAAAAAATMHTETECVHVYSDGSVAVGTDGRSTQPTAWGNVVATYHPDRAADPWDCFEAVGDGEGDDEGTTTPCTYAEWCREAPASEEHPDDEGEGDEETTSCTCAKVWGGDGGGPCDHDAEGCWVRYVPEYLRETARAAGTRRGVWTTVEVSCTCWSTISEAIERGDLEAEWYEALPLV